TRENATAHHMIQPGKPQVTDLRGVSRSLTTRVSVAGLTALDALGTQCGVVGEPGQRGAHAVPREAPSPRCDI
ncbi:MAG: hypothetical protein ACRDS0_13175, partial [Pseudonocardiaceae bacterium]